MIVREARSRTLSCEEDIPTPALIIDFEKVQRNLERVAEYTSSHGLKLRPHTKTHKSQLMAREQLARGAVGLTVAKLGEAACMAEVCDDLLVGYPIVDPHRAAAIAQVAREKTVRVAVDSLRAVQALAEAGRAAGVSIGVLVDVDVGFHRTGVQTPESALELAQAIDRSPGLRFDGAFCFPGHIVAPPEAQMAELAKVDRVLKEVLALWAEHSLSAEIVSGGSTPTGRTSHQVTSYTEIRPGTYIYFDWNSAAGQWCDLDDCAASVVSTVVSTAVPGKFVVDAGSKSLARDQHVVAPESSGYGHLPRFPDACVTRLSEEHGEVDIRDSAELPELGQRVHIIPNHICPCVNLHDHFWLRRDETTYERINVDDRGCVV